VVLDAGPAGVCAITDDVVAFTATGDCTVTASVAADDNWQAASASQTFTVAKADQTITFTSPAPTDPVVGGTHVPEATATSALPVTMSVDPTTDAACTMADGTVTFTAVGTCVIRADQPGDADWNPAEPVTRTIAVGHRTATVTIDDTTATY